MTNLILDHTVIYCLAYDQKQSEEINSLWELRSRNKVFLWLYTGEIRDISEALGNDNAIYHPLGKVVEQPTHRQKVVNYMRSCNWLACLSEDLTGIADENPVVNALLTAGKRLGDDTLIVTLDDGRLNIGHPFVSPQYALDCSNTNAQERIELVDLKVQQEKVRNKVESNLHKVLHHGLYIGGPENDRVEADLANYVGVDYCIGMSSGTDALLVSMMALNIGPGDEVITSPFSFAAAVEAIVLVGATPVYADIDPHTYNLDACGIKSVISRRTRAIMPVSLYGQCCDMDQINEIAEVYGVPVIEDGAQSFGSLYKERRSCGLSTIGCTSFFPSKPLGAYGDAGACFTSDSELALVIRQISNHGQSSRYRHVKVGLNARMDSFQAGVLSAKLSVFEEELELRRVVAERYNVLLNDLVNLGEFKLPSVEAYNTSAWAQYTIEVSDRDNVQKFLSEMGVATAVHYPEPLYRQPAMSDPRTNCPNAERASKRVISLPMHPYLTSDNQQIVATTLFEAIRC